MNTETGGGHVRSGISKAATIIAVVLSALFVLFVINQTAQIVALADRVSPTLGTAVLWTLLALYAAAVGAVAFQYAKLPKPLRPPAGKDDPEFSRYIARLKARLRRNPYVEDMPLETEEDLEAALTVLAKRADEVTRTTALQVFPHHRDFAKRQPGRAGGAGGPVPHGAADRPHIQSAPVVP